MKITAFVRRLLSNRKNEFAKLKLGKVSDKEVQRIEEELGIDLTDFERVLDNSGINHAFKKHGNPKTESLRGQVAITPEDFEKILEIVQNPDLVEYRDKNAIGHDVILYEKTYEAIYCYMEGIRESKKKNRKEVYLETFFKKKAPKHKG